MPVAAKAGRLSRAKSDREDMVSIQDASASSDVMQPKMYFEWNTHL